MKPEFANLTPKKEALERVCAVWKPIRETEIVPIEAANGRVLAEDQLTCYDLPVVRASSMDGVAVKSERFADGIPDTSQWKLGEDFVRADTGDDFPDAYDAVIAIENVEIGSEIGMTIHGDVKVQKGLNVKGPGSTVQKGTLIARAGTMLDAAAMSAIAMGGHAEVPVVRKPRVAFVPTGSELVPVGTVPGRGQNIDSNSVLVRQMLLDMGAEPIMHPIVRDDPAALEAAIDELLPQADLLLLNAGTSKGGEDYCSHILEARGSSIFRGIAAVPGRPMNAAMLGDTPAINLYGPSFAAFYSTDYMVRGLVCYFLGIPVPVRETVTATLTGTLNKPPFFSNMAAIGLEQQPDGSYTATPMGLRGKGAVGATASLMAQGVYVTQPGEPVSQAGDTVSVELLRNRAVIPQAG